MYKSENFNKCLRCVVIMYVLVGLLFVSVMIFCIHVSMHQLFRVFALGRIFLDFNISACYFIVFM